MSGPFGPMLRTGRATWPDALARLRRKAPGSFPLTGFMGKEFEARRASQGRPAVAADAARPRSARPSLMAGTAREREEAVEALLMLLRPCAQKVVRLFGQAAWSTLDGHL